MLALGSVWTGAASLLIALAMLAYRPAFTDVLVTVVLWFGSPGALCLGGLTLWAHRDDADDDSGVAARRVQAKTGIGLSLAAAAIVYGLIISSTKLEPLERASKNQYNSHKT